MPPTSAHFPQSNSGLFQPRSFGTVGRYPELHFFVDTFAFPFLVYQDHKVHMDPASLSDINVNCLRELLSTKSLGTHLDLVCLYLEVWKFPV